MKLPAALEGFWDARSPRERTALLAAAALVLAAGLWAFLWEPGIAARQKLSSTLPKLRAQVEDMRRQQKEITDLRKAIGMRPARADLRALLAASAERAPFARSVERIDPASPGRVHFAAAPVDFDAWLEWIEALQREFGVRVESCRIAALGRPGLVRLEAVFATGGGAGAR